LEIIAKRPNLIWQIKRLKNHKKIVEYPGLSIILLMFGNIKLIYTN